MGQFAEVGLVVPPLRSNEKWPFGRLHSGRNRPERRRYKYLIYATPPLMQFHSYRRLRSPYLSITYLWIGT